MRGQDDGIGISQDLSTDTFWKADVQETACSCIGGSGWDCDVWLLVAKTGDTSTGLVACGSNLDASFLDVMAVPCEVLPLQGAFASALLGLRFP